MVLDLGAHRGEFAKELGRRLGCTCYAVEANPALSALIDATPQLTVFNYAVCSVDSPVELQIESNLECSRVALEGTPPLSRPVSTAVVPGKRLETLLGELGLVSIDLLKVDIEGAEIPVFRGAPEKLLRTVGQITIEFHDFMEELDQGPAVAEVIERLKALGFIPVVFTKRNHADVLFVNRARVVLGPLDRFYLEHVSRYAWWLRRLLARVLPRRGTG